MDAFVDYDFYRDEYHGTSIPAQEFDRRALDASAYIREITYGRVPPVTNEVRLAVCAVADAAMRYEGREGLSSESVGDVSVVYGSAGAGVGDIPLSRRMYDAARTYLQHTGLLYRGVRG
ncbi:MAG: hypothetical protein LBD12_01995 [Clostridiales Family XIII bacterium]|jgi:hypothetical protein|nr:hypothetical protein [Clostridiales Family XIII bacterium]